MMDKQPDDPGEDWDINAPITERPDMPPSRWQKFKWAIRRLFQ